MATLRKDGRWQAVWTDPKTGKRKAAYAKTESQAEERKEIALAEARHRGKPTPSADLKLHDLAGLLWWPQVESTARDNTLRRYRVAYKGHIRPRWGHRHLADIRTSEVQAWVNSMSKAGIAPSSIQLYKGILSAIFKACMGEELADRNPTAVVRVPKAARRRRVMNVSDARRLLAGVEGTSLACPVYLAVVLGMRRGEICGLRWANVDIPARRISITEQRIVRHGQKIGKGVESAPLKTEGSERSFKLPSALFDPVLRLGNLDSAYVCTERGAKPWNPEHLTWEWASVRTGLGFAGWHFHDLRHGAAAVLASIPGISLLTIAAILGHRSIDTTQLYAAAQEESASEGFDKLAAVLFSSREPST